MFLVSFPGLKQQPLINHQRRYSYLADSGTRCVQRSRVRASLEMSGEGLDGGRARCASRPARPPLESRDRSAGCGAPPASKARATWADSRRICAAEAEAHTTCSCSLYTYRTVQYITYHVLSQLMNEIESRGRSDRAAPRPAADSCQCQSYRAQRPEIRQKAEGARTEASWCNGARDCWRSPRTRASPLRSETLRSNLHVSTAQHSSRADRTVLAGPTGLSAPVALSLETRRVTAADKFGVFL